MARIADDILVQCVAGRVHQIARVVSAQYDEALRPYGVTANQLTILCLVSSLGPARSVDLEPYLAMDQSTLSRNLDRMIKNGWIEKRRADDARAINLQLSPKGRHVLKKAAVGWREAQRWATALLGDAAVQDIRRTAKTLNPNIPE